MALRLKVEGALFFEQAAPECEVGLDDGAPWHVSGRAVGAHAPRHGTSAGGLSELRDDIVADLVNCETATLRVI